MRLDIPLIRPHASSGLSRLRALPPFMGGRQGATGLSGNDLQVLFRCFPDKAAHGVLMGRDLANRRMTRPTCAALSAGLCD